MRSIIVFFILLVEFSFSQNLVPNFSFEENHKCPPDFVTFYRETYVKNWVSPNTGTPDYFNTCANKCGIPHNWVGSAEAYHGNAYMGIIACMQQHDERQIPYREYLRIKLLEPLESGQVYFASVKVRLAESCIASCSGVGIHFSDREMNSHRNINYTARSDITFADNLAPIDKNNWLNICGKYIARGGEEYLFIGNFLSNQQMDYYEFDENFITSPNTTPMAYFYIDHVVVEKFNPELVYDCSNINSELIAEFDGQLYPGDKVVLKNLHFEFDKALILSSSYDELNKLADLLLARPLLKIVLHGHTDNKGTQEYNRTLSEERAQAVKNYLIRKGISRMRLSTQAHGSSLPINFSGTEDGRALNRRVEIEVVNN